MSKIISTNKLNRFWVNGIKPTIDKVKNTIKDRSGLMDNIEEDKLADALAIKDALDYFNVGRNTNGQYSSLEEFVEATSMYSNTPSIGRCKDISENGWSNGVEPFSQGNQWYRYMIVYSARYLSGNTNDVHGNGIFWHRSGKMYNVLITGTKETGLTLKYEVINKPTITSRKDLMANTLSGLFPDALAVKDAINEYRPTIYSTKSYATLEEFITDMASSGESIGNTPFKAGTVRDMGGWGPKKTTETWYQYMAIVSGSAYVSAQQNNTVFRAIFMDSSGSMWNATVTGKKDTGLTVTYKSLLATNSADDKVKNTTATIIGLTVAGEFVYNNSSLKYYVTGNVLHLSLNISIKEVITHPEGEFRITADLPDVFATKTLEGPGTLNVCYTKGGYKQGFRRIATANIELKGSTGIYITPRQFITSEAENVSPHLSNTNFVNNFNLIKNNDSKIYILNQDKTVVDNLIQMHGSVLLKDR